jgi:hypothetical protein
VRIPSIRTTQLKLGDLQHECSYVAIFFLHHLDRALIDNLRTPHGGDIDPLSRTLDTCWQQFPHLSEWNDALPLINFDVQVLPGSVPG